ncbi:leucine-rich repeat extensin-like protein 3 [Iris pallida]|uniref:Leucine-rich repeat extensin-like protein 3 n=1 Tax=Iris pallida TaxID=29817 RepID=A0AAX6G3S5_IRIPA|nr:leucine-rich repeat extensin-like protein 3 [Iris pallida]
MPSPPPPRVRASASEAAPPPPGRALTPPKPTHHRSPTAPSRRLPRRSSPWSATTMGSLSSAAALAETLAPTGSRLPCPSSAAETLPAVSRHSPATLLSASFQTEPPRRSGPFAASAVSGSRSPLFFQMAKWTIPNAARLSVSPAKDLRQV